MATLGGQMPMFWSKKNWKISFFVSSNGSISGVIDKVFFYFLYIYFKFSFLVEYLLPNEEPTPMRWIRGLSLNYLKIWIPSYLKAPPPYFDTCKTPRVLICRDTSYCLVIYLEETLSCFISIVFLWLFCQTKWFKLRSY